MVSRHSLPENKPLPCGAKYTAKSAWNTACATRRTQPRWRIFVVCLLFRDTADSLPCVFSHTRRNKGLLAACTHGRVLAGSVVGQPKFQHHGCQRTFMCQNSVVCLLSCLPCPYVCRVLCGVSAVFNMMSCVDILLLWAKYSAICLREYLATTTVSFPVVINDDSNPIS
jgi:hypothetical protein